MQYLSIGVNKYTDESINYLINKLNRLKKENIKIKTHLTKLPNFRIVTCKLDEGKIKNPSANEKFNLLKQYVSVILSDYIIKYYEEKLLSRIININYCYFNHEEKKQILELSISLLKFKENDTNFSFPTNRYINLISKNLQEYFESNHEILIDGFVNFRIKEYINELEEIVDRAVDTYLIKKEYQEFIKLVRYFVEIQEPKLESIHILPDENKKYIILDHDHNEITNECVKIFLNEIPYDYDNKINLDDLLISSLITFAPLKIYLHSVKQIENKEIIETIKNIFLNKVVICSGCNLCKLSKIKGETLTN